jgi:hypothetical protein
VSYHLTMSKIIETIDFVADATCVRDQKLACTMQHAAST